MKVYLGKGTGRGTGGISRAVESLLDYLHLYNIGIVDNIHDADVMHAHIAVYEEVPNHLPLVVSSHGMLWHDHGWGSTGLEVNSMCTESYLMADVVTAPSDFVARAIQRHTLRKPLVVRHGIDASLWKNETSLEYVLWNKARPDAACNPIEMNTVAELLPNIRFVSTFGKATDNVSITGFIPFDKMQSFVQQAGVYLDTPQESGGPCFGVLEAMAAGVPTVAWRNGGNAEAVVHGETGYLVDVGNYDGLAEGIEYCLKHRARLGKNARALVEEKYTLEQSLEGYIKAYHAAVDAVYDHAVDVSIIIPAYNMEQYVEKAVQSAIDQTHQSIEVIVINDASTDATGDIIDGFSDVPNVTVLHNVVNLHVSDTRNRAVGLASGRYILPLDADDALMPNAVELMLKELNDNKDLHIVAGKLLLSNEQGTIQDKLGGWPDSVDLKLQLKGMNRLPYCSMYRKYVWKSVGGYRRRITTGVEDADFWTRALSYGYKAEVINKPVLRYLMRDNSLGKQNQEGNDAWLKWFPWTRDTSLLPAGAPIKNVKTHSFDIPQVSVVIPVGPGHLKHIQACIDGLISQTNPLWEAILINDTGERWFDDNQQPLTQHVMGVPAVFIDGDKNNGVAWARNRGIERARSKFVIFLDVDDIAQPGMIDALLVAHRTSSGWIYGDWYHTTDEEVKYNNAPDWNVGGFIQKQLAPITGLYEHEHLVSIGGFDENAPGWEDWDLQLRLFGKGICGTRVAYPLIMYHMNYGWRREDNFADAENVLKYIQEKHEELFNLILEGRIMPCRSCGGNSTVSINQSTTERANEMYNDTSLVPVKYIGKKAGKRSFKPPGTHRSYRFKIGATINVHPDDVAYFTASTDFEVVGDYNIGNAIPEIEVPLAAETKQVPDKLSDLLAEVNNKVPDIAEEIGELKEEAAPLADKVFTGLLVLDFAPKIIKALQKAGIRSVEELDEMADSQLLLVKGIGETSVKDIREAIGVWKLQS
jgi:glycosyltransferase involved in cell wall biosynthesis